VAKQCGCQREYIWHGRSVSIWYTLTVTWSSAVIKSVTINGPHNIVVLSFQCKCAWALGKLYVKSIAKTGIKLWKLSVVWLLSTTGSGVYMMQSVSSSQLYNLKSMCYFKCNETVSLYYCDLNFSKFVYISQNIIQSWTCNRQRFVCIPWKRTAPQDTCVWSRPERGLQTFCPRATWGNTEHVEGRTSYAMCLLRDMLYSTKSTNFS